MKKTLSIAIAQLNFTVGDLQGNCDKILASHKKAHGKGADLVVYSEMAVTGYPPEDLVLRSDFQDQAMERVRSLAVHTKHAAAMLVGSIWREGEHVYNAAILLDGGEIKHVVSKYDLPNYGVFDEKRLFCSGPEPRPIEFRGIQLGVMICEDMWNDKVCPVLQRHGAQMLVVLNASPFESDKQSVRQDIALKNVKKTGLPLIYVNPVGGQDELVFEGSSFIYSHDGMLCVKARQWEEELCLSQWKQEEGKWRCAPGKVVPDTDRYEAVYRGITLGLRDYVEKNGFPGVVLGMSGGVDSALTAAIAVDALGAERVHAVMMPYHYTSEESIIDAEQCISLLNVENYSVIGIEKAVEAFGGMLKESFAGKKADTTEENLQSRIRGNILMALSNKHGYMVLTTGNKSEMAVGYATLYGDMCGGFNVLKDLYKTEIYALAKWRNKQGKVIAENVLTKAPTAELRPDQTDQDSLPPYDVLDDILHKLIERRMSARQVAQSGYPQEVVDKVAHLLKLAEYKRRQAPPGVKITGLAFGRDRRYPITSRFEF